MCIKGDTFGPPEMISGVTETGGGRAEMASEGTETAGRATEVAGRKTERVSGATESTGERAEMTGGAARGTSGEENRIGGGAVHADGDNFSKRREGGIWGVPPYFGGPYEGRMKIFCEIDAGAGKGGGGRGAPQVAHCVMSRASRGCVLGRRPESKRSADSPHEVRPQGGRRPAIAPLP
jgi:hypothetical protein